ncbi:MAG: GTPase Era [Desulfovibrionaceae bacterium]|nr:GTPase Era [Desulfovibrionaceae bacterium]
MKGSMKNRCGRVALIGPPNAGKSTLLNALLGQKITIVTPKPQTTRSQIVGILTESGSQAIFFDTPGLSTVRGRLSRTMTQAVWESLRQADVLLPVLDANCYSRHGEILEKDIAPFRDALENESRPLLFALNKVDLLGDKTRLLPLIERLNGLWPKAELFPVSAETKDGLDGLKDLLIRLLPEGEPEYPDDQLSTQPVRFMVSEIIREKIYLNLRQEVPYGCAVAVETWEYSAETDQTVIGAVIFVARPIYKAMVIGHGGTMIRKIGTEARREIKELLDGNVHLDLWVSVKEHRIDDPEVLGDLLLAGADRE